MRKPSLLSGALLGGLTSLPFLAIMYLGQHFGGLPFVPFDLFDWFTRVLPGGAVTESIEALVSIIRTLNLGPTSETAKTIEQGIAILLTVAGAVTTGTLLALLMRRTTLPGWQLGALLGVLLLIFITFIKSSIPSSGNPTTIVLWLGVLILGWATVLGNLIENVSIPASLSEQNRAGRRSTLIKVASVSLGTTLLAFGISRIRVISQEANGAGEPLAGLPTTPSSEPSPQVQPSATTATVDTRLQPAPGTRPEVTPDESFYRIDINSLPINIDGRTWELKMDGLFDKPRTLKLAELMAYPSVTQAITLSCISNPVGGDLIGTTYWTGVQLRTVLQDLGIRPEARHLFVVGSDGFHETVSMQDMMDARTLLVYGMNGKTLTPDHGFPLRIYIPNRYGMKQPKWIVGIKAVEQDKMGYWVERTWSKEARPQITSVIDPIVKEVRDGRVAIGGIAWAGDRGIQNVEVQVDGKEWVAAALRTPPLSQLTWVQWRYDWPVTPGLHTFSVRATDSTGALQIESPSDTHPNGATGYHSLQASF